MQLQAQRIPIATRGHAVDGQPLLPAGDAEPVDVDPRGVENDLPGPDSPGPPVGRERRGIETDAHLRNAALRVPAERGGRTEQGIGPVVGVVEPRGQVDPVLLSSADHRKIGHVHSLGEQVGGRHEKRNRIALIAAGGLEVGYEKPLVLDQLRVERQREDIALGIEQEDQLGPLSEPEPRRENARHVVRALHVHVEQVVTVDTRGPGYGRNRILGRPGPLRERRQIGTQRVAEIREHVLVAELAPQLGVGERRVQPDQLAVASVLGKQADTTRPDRIELVDVGHVENLGFPVDVVERSA